MKKIAVRSLVMSFVAAAAATVGMVLIPRLNNPDEFAEAPALAVHLLISFGAVFAVCVPVSALFYWLRDSMRR